MPTPVMRTANPARVTAGDLVALTESADIVMVRLLGGTCPNGIAALRRTGPPLVALGGQALPDAELMALPTVPAGIATDMLGSLREGGLGNSASWPRSCPAPSC